MSASSARSSCSASIPASTRCASAWRISATKSDEAQLEDLFPRFKTLADKKREVFDSDLDALALGQDPATLGPWTLEQLHATSHLGGGASASVQPAPRRRPQRRRSRLDRRRSGARGAARDRARHRQSSSRSTDFQIRSLSYGADAQGRATLTVSHAGREWCGRGVSTDIVEAAALAALEVVNRIERINLGQALPLAANQA